MQREGEEGAGGGDQRVVVADRAQERHRGGGVAHVAQRARQLDDRLRAVRAARPRESLPVQRDRGFFLAERVMQRRPLECGAGILLSTRVEEAPKLCVRRRGVRRIEAIPEQCELVDGISDRRRSQRTLQRGAHALLCTAEHGVGDGCPREHEQPARSLPASLKPPASRCATSSSIPIVRTTPVSPSSQCGSATRRQPAATTTFLRLLGVEQLARSPATSASPGSIRPPGSSRTGARTDAELLEQEGVTGVVNATTATVSP
jgi:hypothetical protein